MVRIFSMKNVSIDYQLSRVEKFVVKKLFQMKEMKQLMQKLY